MPEKLAYIRPDEQLMTFLPEGHAHKYRTGRYGPSDIDTGYYRIDYASKERSQNGNSYTVYYLNQAQQTAPQSGEMIASVVREITGFSDRILSRLDCHSEDPESIMERLQDESWLREIRGIGEVRGESLAESFRSITPGNLRVFAAFRKHGLPYREDTKREKWATAFFELYESELESFEENPYHLLRIADSDRYKVRNLSKERPELTPVGYTLSWIDERVGDQWQDSPERARAFFEQAFERITDEGHTVCTGSQLASKMRWLGFDRIRTSDGSIRLDSEVTFTLERDVDELTRIRFSNEGRLEKGITSQGLQSKARSIAENVRWLSRNDTPLSDIAQEKLIERACEAQRFDLDRDQKNAIRYAFTSPISIVTGPAGSGKTTVVLSILSSAAGLLQEREEYMAADQPKERKHTAMDLYVLAPTGKAAQRVRKDLQVEDPHTGRTIEVSTVSRDQLPNSPQHHLEQGQMQVGTLHSFLGWKGQYCDTPAPHPSFIIVDESSMSDVDIVYWLFRYVEACLEAEVPITLLLTGDVEQLEPVGRGHPYRDLLGRTGDSAVPSTNLSQIHRQGQGSAIVDASRRILDGEQPLVPSQVENRDGLKNDFYWHDYPRGELDIGRHLNSVADRAQKYTGEPVSREDVQLILPLRNQSSIDPDAPYVKRVNDYLQQTYAEARGNQVHTLTACPPEEPDTTYGNPLTEGDRVTHTGNNRYQAEGSTHQPVMRGAVGTIVTAGKDGVWVEYPWADQLVPYREPEEIHQLTLAYALTGHTAQGSEFEVTSVILPKEAAPTLIVRSWLYTAITRGSKFVNLMAPQDRVLKAAREDAVGSRQTLLSNISY